MTQPEGIAPAIITPASPAEAGQNFLLDLEGRWVGEGINTLWVPSAAQPDGPPPVSTYDPTGGGLQRPVPLFVSSRTTETIVVGPSLGSVPNKGATDSFNELAAPYEQQSFNENGGLIHAESGYWLVTPATTTPVMPAPQVAKLSAIPHGTTTIVQGPLPNKQTGQALIVVNDVAPVAPAPLPPGIPNPVSSLAAEYLANMAAYITARVAADRTGALWELHLASSGVANIAFLQENAQVTSVQTTLWIGNLGIRADGDGSDKSSVLAYVQTTMLRFDDVDWPHVSVGYLLKDMSTLVQQHPTY